MNETLVRPSYLGLLNAISLAESRAGIYLKAWADVTPDPELRRALALVASRETAHGEVFRQRIERLGFSLRDREDPGFADRLRVYGDPNTSDLDKIRYGRREETDGADPLAGVEERAQDESVDQLTRDTLRWYIHEERDSGDLLKAAYARVQGNATTAALPAGSDHAATVGADTQAILACLSEGFAALQRTMTERLVSVEQRLVELSEASTRREKHKER